MKTEVNIKRNISVDRISIMNTKVKKEFAWKSIIIQYKKWNWAIKKSKISLEDRYATEEYKNVNNKNVNNIKRVILYWKDVYVKWPNHEETEYEDQKLKSNKMDIQGIETILNASLKETIKKVFFVLEL